MGSNPIGVATSEWTPLHSKSPAIRLGISHTTPSFLLFRKKGHASSKQASLSPIFEIKISSPLRSFSSPRKVVKTLREPKSLLACKRARDASACYQPFSGCWSSISPAEMSEISFSCGLGTSERVALFPIFYSIKNQSPALLFLLTPQSLYDFAGT